MSPHLALPEPWDESDGDLDPDGSEPVDQWEDRRAERSVRTDPDARRTPRGRSRRADAWEPPRTLRQRIGRAVSVPYLAGAVVFVAAIAVALGFVWFQPHLPPADAGGSGDLTAVSASDGKPSEDSGTETTAGKDSVSTDSAADASTAAGTVFVHVVGAVKAPGVVELPADSRVRDAVAGAGGATDAAVLAGVNLARVVVDGEQIVVPDAASMTAGNLTGTSANGVPPGATNSGLGPTGAVAVDLNTADLAALESLPRVGPALAQRILDWRTSNGRFTSVDQLLEVPGIGAKTLEGFRDRVRVS